MTRSSWRPRPIVLAPLIAAALVLTGCGGGDKKDSKAGAGSTPSGSQGAVSSDGSPEPKGSGGVPLAPVEPAKVKSLVGKWTTTGPAKDYFLFKADGTGSWMAKGRSLWTGQVIPDGKNKFRFSWEGKDPQQSTYWGVTLESGGKSLVFGGTNQTYNKAKK